MCAVLGLLDVVVTRADLLLLFSACSKIADNQGKPAASDATPPPANFDASATDGGGADMDAPVLGLKGFTDFFVRLALLSRPSGANVPANSSMSDRVSWFMSHVGLESASAEELQERERAWRKEKDLGPFENPRSS